MASAAGLCYPQARRHPGQNRTRFNLHLEVAFRHADLADVNISNRCHPQEHTVGYLERDPNQTAVPSTRRRLCLNVLLSRISIALIYSVFVRETRWWRQLESNQPWAALAFRLAPRDLSPCNGDATGIRTRDYRRERPTS